MRCADAATARPLSAQRLGSPMGNTLTAYTDKLCLIVETNGLKNVLHPLEKRIDICGGVCLRMETEYSLLP